MILCEVLTFLVKEGKEKSPLEESSGDEKILGKVSPREQEAFEETLWRLP